MPGHREVLGRAELILNDSFLIHEPDDDLAA